MGRRMKYIRHRKFGIILFPDNNDDSMMHSSIAYKFGRSNIISAGFTRLKDGKFVCYGMSESLNMKSIETDTPLLNSHFDL